MAIYGQPNSWQCGPFALKHALLALGRFTHEDELTLLSGANEVRGTDEKGLSRAARAHGCRLTLVRRTERATAHDALTATLTQGSPALLCIDQWAHWVAVVGFEGDRFVVFDSHFDQPLRIEPWRQLGDRLAYRQRRWLGTRTLYDIHPVEPRGSHRVRLALSPPRAERLLAAGDGSLVRDWDELARRVLAIAAPTGPQLELGTPLADWVKGHRALIAEAAAHDGGDGDQALCLAALDEVALVATLYGAVLRPEDEPKAEGRLAALVAERVSSMSIRISSGTGSSTGAPTEGFLAEGSERLAGSRPRAALAP